MTTWQIVKAVLLMTPAVRGVIGDLVQTLQAQDVRTARQAERAIILRAWASAHGIPREQVDRVLRGSQDD